MFLTTQCLTFHFLPGFIFFFPEQKCLLHCLVQSREVLIQNEQVLIEMVYGNDATRGNLDAGCVLGSCVPELFGESFLCSFEKLFCVGKV